MNGAAKLTIGDSDAGAVISVKVVPGASRDRIAGMLGECLKVTTSAPPEKGKANSAVAKILAEAFDIDRKAVVLVSSPTNPRKQFLLEGFFAEEVRQRIENLFSTGPEVS